MMKTETGTGHSVEEGGMEDTLEFRGLTVETWPDFETFFESKGAPKYCWCMAWRSTSEEAKHNDSTHRKQFMKERVFRGMKCGILGYKNGSAIAWCSVAPKTSYRKLTDVIEADIDTTWSIVCFFIKREYRGQGIQEKMLEEAIKYARSNGAKRVEAYPVERDSPSYRFMGYVNLFEKSGFIYVGSAGTRRKVYKKDVP